MISATIAVEADQTQVIAVMEMSVCGACPQSACKTRHSLALSL